MEFLSGRTVRPGIAIGGAARISDEFGAPSLDAQRRRQLGERLRRAGLEGSEEEQVILVGDHVDASFLANPLHGLEYVGLAATDLTGDPRTIACPAVADLPQSLISLVEENDIIIIDGERGRVFIAPDAATIARYQAPIRRSRRIFLGSEHLPARTASDNRPIAVIGRADSLSSAVAATEHGADGLWVPGDNDFLAPENGYQPSSEQFDELRKLADTTGGKPILLDIPVDRLSLTAIARAAFSASLHLIVCDDLTRIEIGEQLAGIEQALDTDDVRYGSVHFEFGLSVSTEEQIPESLGAYTGLCVLDCLEIARIDSVILAAGQTRHAGKPLTMILSETNWDATLQEALELSADRLVVSAETIEAVKDAIRVS